MKRNDSKFFTKHISRFIGKAKNQLENAMRAAFTSLHQTTVETPAMRFIKLIGELVKKGRQNGDKNGIQNCLKNTLILAQIFGLMPVSGITAGKIESVRFLWVSFRTVYALLRIIGALFFIVLQILRMQTYGGSSLGEYRLLMFYICGFSSAVNFLLLARKWPMIMRKWHFLEFSFNEYGWPKNLNMTINSFLTLYLFAAFGKLLKLRSLNLIW